MVNDSKFIQRVKSIVAVSTTLLTLSVPLTAFGQTSDKAASNCNCANKCHETNAAKSDVQIPRTAEEHLAKAESYRQKAEQYRREAAEHRNMKEEYRRTIAQTPKTVFENPWMKKMRLHCDNLIKQAELMANEAEMFANYHTLRAKELQGQ